MEELICISTSCSGKRALLRPVAAAFPKVVQNTRLGTFFHQLSYYMAHSANMQEKLQKRTAPEGAVL
jgi:hypothetical protein